MTFSEFQRNVARGIGKFLGTISGSLRRLPKPQLRAAIAEPPALPDTMERVRTVVVEELTRLLGVTGTVVTRAEFEERLRHMVASILVLQQKIRELSVHGPVSEADLSEAIAAVSARESLGVEERSIMEGIFRQNITIQKPDLVNALADGGKT